MSSGMRNAEVLRLYLSKLLMPPLQMLCRMMGLRTAGRKVEVVNRIVSQVVAGGGIEKQMLTQLEMELKTPYGQQFKLPADFKKAWRKGRSRPQRTPVAAPLPPPVRVQVQAGPSYPVPPPITPLSAPPWTAAHSPSVPPPLVPLTALPLPAARHPPGPLPVPATASQTTSVAAVPSPGDWRHRGQRGRYSTLAVVHNPAPALNPSAPAPLSPAQSLVASAGRAATSLPGQPAPANGYGSTSQLPLDLTPPGVSQAQRSAPSSQSHGCHRANCSNCAPRAHASAPQPRPAATIHQHHHPHAAAKKNQHPPAKTEVSLSAIKWRTVPHYRVLQPIVGERLRTAQFVLYFALSDLQLSSLKEDPSMRILFLMSSYNGAVISSKALGQKPCYALIDMRLLGQLHVNQTTVQQVPAKTSGLRGRVGCVHPIDITNMVVKSSVQQYVTGIIYEPQQYVATIALAKKLPVDSLVEECQARVMSTEERLKRLCPDDGDTDHDDIRLGRTVISLRDPLAYTRIEVPLRTRKCEHAECFDAKIFFTMNEQTPTYTCPICHIELGSAQSCTLADAEAGSDTFRESFRVRGQVMSEHVAFDPLEELLVDEHFLNMLKATPASVESVTLLEDGTWETEAATSAAEDSALASSAQSKDVAVVEDVDAVLVTARSTSDNTVVLLDSDDEVGHNDGDGGGGGYGTDSSDIVVVRQSIKSVSQTSNIIDLTQDSDDDDVNGHTYVEESSSSEDQPWWGPWHRGSESERSSRSPATTSTPTASVLALSESPSLLRSPGVDHLGAPAVTSLQPLEAASRPVPPGVSSQSESLLLPPILSLEAAVSAPPSAPNPQAAAAPSTSTTRTIVADAVDHTATLAPTATSSSHVAPVDVVPQPAAAISANQVTRIQEMTAAASPSISTNESIAPESLAETALATPVLVVVAAPTTVSATLAAATSPESSAVAPVDTSANTAAPSVDSVTTAIARSPVTPMAAPLAPECSVTTEPTVLPAPEPVLPPIDTDARPAPLARASTPPPAAAAAQEPEAMHKCSANDIAPMQVEAPAMVRVPAPQKPDVALNSDDTEGACDLDAILDLDMEDAEDSDATEGGPAAEDSDATEDGQIPPSNEAAAPEEPERSKELAGSAGPQAQATPPASQAPTAQTAPATQDQTPGKSAPPPPLTPPAEALLSLPSPSTNSGPQPSTSNDMPTTPVSDTAVPTTPLPVPQLQQQLAEQQQQDEQPSASPPSSPALPPLPSIAECAQVIAQRQQQELFSNVLMPLPLYSPTHGSKRSSSGVKYSRVSSHPSVILDPSSVRSARAVLSQHGFLEVPSAGHALESDGATEQLPSAKRQKCSSKTI